MPTIKLTTERGRSEAMLYEQRWMYKTVMYEEGRVGTVIDLSRDGKRLCVRRDSVRGRDSETLIIWVNSSDVQIVDVKRND